MITINKIDKIAKYDTTLSFEGKALNNDSNDKTYIKYMEATYAKVPDELAYSVIAQDLKDKELQDQSGDKYSYFEVNNIPHTQVIKKKDKYSILHVIETNDEGSVVSMSWFIETN